MWRSMDIYVLVSMEIIMGIDLLISMDELMSMNLLIGSGFDRM